MASKQATATKGAAAAKGAGLGLWKILAIVLIAILAVGGLAYYKISGNLSPTAALPQFPRSANTSAPQGLSAAISQSSTSLAPLAEYMQANANSSQFHVFYNGSFAAHVAQISFIPSFSTPLNVRKSVYAGNSKFEINATGVPVAGDVDIQYLSLSNGTYVCTNFNASALSSNPSLLVTNKGSPECTQGSGISSALGELAQFNFSSLEYYGIQAQYNDSYQSSYMGAPCTFVDYSLTQSQDGSVGGIGSLQLCISNAYSVPVSIGMNLSTEGGNAFRLVLNESSIGNSASQGYTETLPYPVS